MKIFFTTILILIISFQNVFSQIIEEGKGIDSITLGIKESKVVSILGNECNRTAIDSNDYILNFKKKNLKIAFDKDSIVYEIIIATKAKRQTSKGLFINKRLKLSDVEKVYGNGDDSWYTTDSINVYFGYDCGISFRVKAIYEDGKMLNVWNSELDTAEIKYLNLKIDEISIEQSDLETGNDYSFYEYINSIYIPKNIDECITQINSFWKDSLKNEVKKLSEEDFIGEAHFGFGRWTRNNWGLWAGSRLAIYFRNYGIPHPDNMSSIILRSYHRSLKNKNKGFEGQINKYLKFFEEQKRQDELIRKGQTKEILKSKKWLNKKGIRFYEIRKLEGRSQFFNCDSMIVLRKINEDTIMYWTTASLTPLEIKEAEEWIKSENVQKNGYVNVIQPDGRINFIILSQKTFVCRNDSLFEKDDYYEISKDSIMSLYKSWIFKSKNEKEKKYYSDLINENTLHSYKLMFTPSLFYEKDTIQSKSIHFENDVIILNGYWQIENVKYYQITVENKVEKTKYSYRFDENFRFIDWEGCNKDIIDNLVEDKKRKFNK